MQKMLCPFCDHVIKGKGKCDYCGSWVKKPVVAKTSAEFNAQASADPICPAPIRLPAMAAALTLPLPPFPGAVFRSGSTEAPPDFPVP